jgi:hypothetical protein
MSKAQKKSEEMVVESSSAAGTELSASARMLVGTVIGFGSLILLYALLTPAPVHPWRVLIWGLFAALFSMAKVRFPSVNGAYSIGFIVVLASIAYLPFPEVAIIAVVGAVGQSLWKPLTRPKAVQVIFNVYNYTLSAWCSYCCFHESLRLDPSLATAARFTLSAAVFFVVNSGLVSWIIALVSGRTFVSVFERPFLLTYPFFLIGAAAVGFVVCTGGVINWTWLIPMLPLFAVLYGSMRVWLREAAC